MAASLSTGRRRGKSRIDLKIEEKTEIKKTKKSNVGNKIQVLTEKVKNETNKKENGQNYTPKEILCPCCWEAIKTSSLQTHFFECASSMTFL